jgi:hypothetical protein
MPEPTDTSEGSVKSWLDTAREEAAKNPKNIEFKKMLSEIRVATDPLKVIPDTEVPEFQMGAVREGLVNAIGQGQMVSSEGMPLRTDNAANCQLLLLQTPLPENTTRHTLVHIWAGDFELNLPGHRLKDILNLTNDETTAIFVTGSRNHSIVSAARDLKYDGGINTVKHIQAPSQSGYVNLVYRPTTNESLVKVGNIDDTREVLVFEGF